MKLVQAKEILENSSFCQVPFLKCHCRNIIVDSLKKVPYLNTNVNIWPYMPVFFYKQSSTLKVCK